MYLSAFLHREELFEITNRWLCDRFQPQDPMQITRIIAYDSFAAWETLLDVTRRLLDELDGPPSIRKPIRSKRELKDFLCHAAKRHSETTRRLAGRYKECPEFFYVGAPMAGFLYHDQEMNVLAACRFKKARRIAEKANRYASRHIFDMVQKRALALMHDDDSNGHPGATPPRELYEAAEKAVMDQIRLHGLQLPPLPMTIEDVLGLKIVDLGFGEDGLEKAVDALDGVEIVEKEVHAGNYNAVHYIIRAKADFPRLCQRFRQNGKSADCFKRGLPVQGIHEDFSAFLRTGADALHIDMIFTDFEEMLQSEIGRSMHETRIFSQRSNQRVFGNIPVNIEYIMEYLFAVGQSPTVRLDGIPIKIWGRYLPETLGYCIRKLFGMPEYTIMGV